MKRALQIVLGGLVVLALMQLAQCERTNPPVTGDIAAPADVAPLLERACYDCHSNRTVWPWYARFAPVSWLLHRDVVEGRRHVNFSEWDKVPADRKAKKIAACGRQVQEGEMPPWFYLPLHPTARLTAAEKARIVQWAKAPHSD